MKLVKYEGHSKIMNVMSISELVILYCGYYGLMISLFKMYELEYQIQKHELVYTLRMIDQWIELNKNNLFVWRHNPIKSSIYQLSLIPPKALGL